MVEKLEKAPLLGASDRRKVAVQGVYLLGVLGICVSVAFGIVLPSMQFLVLQSKSAHPPGLGENNQMYAWIMGIYGVGEVIGSLVIGHLSNRFPIKILVLLLLPVAMFGAALYFFCVVGWMLLISRVLIGLYTGSQAALIRTYVARVLHPEDRMKVVGILGSLAGLAYAVGPAFGGLLALIPAYQTTVGKWTIHIDPYRTPAMVLFLMFFVGFFLILFFFKELDHETPPSQSPSVNSKNQECKDNSSRKYFGFEFLESWQCTFISILNCFKFSFLDSILIVAFVIFIFFLVNGSLAMAESLTTPVMRDQFGLSVRYTAVTYVIGGVISFAAVIIFMKMGKIDERKPTILVILFLLLGAIMMVDYQAISHDPCTNYSCHWICPANEVEAHREACLADPQCKWIPDGMWHPCPACAEICRNPHRTMNLAQYIIGYCFIMLSTTIGRSSVSTLFANLLGPVKQGSMSGLLIAAAAFGRLIFPVIAISLYDAVARRTFLLMFVLTGVYAGSFAIYFTNYKKFGYKQYYEVQN